MSADDHGIGELLEVMRRLRNPQTGCPWDIEQTFATIAPFTIEEAYEVADAIAREDWGDLEGELGDLLLQVVYHARMAEEAGRFAFADVARSIARKMIERHPHVFGADRVSGVPELHTLWEARKAQERQRKAEAAAADPSALADVPVALPALVRAQKLQKRAGRVGFDWPDAEGVVRKIEEELDELAAARAGRDATEIATELGDLLFTIVNLARHLEVDAETALRAANQRFERRFRAMERLATEPIASLRPSALDELWESAKAIERPQRA